MGEAITESKQWTCPICGDEINTAEVAVNCWARTVSQLTPHAEHVAHAIHSENIRAHRRQHVDEVDELTKNITAELAEIRGLKPSTVEMR